MNESKPVLHTTQPDTDIAAETQNSVPVVRRTEIGGLALVSLEVTERKALPTLEQIPSLRDRISGPDSAHKHKYSETDSTFRISCDAEDTPAAERTDAQKQILKDLETLEQFAVYSLDPQYVYTPDEMHSLVQKLEQLRQKNRPDFNEVEGKLIDFVLRHRTIVDKQTVAGIVKREQEDAENRRGMTWSTLITVAGAANAILDPRLRKGSETRRYIIDIARDPDVIRGDKNAVDLRDVYQFVAFDHAMNVLNDRNEAVTPDRGETFLRNARMIEDWYAEVKPLLDQLPAEHEWLGLDHQGRQHKAGIKLEIQHVVGVLRDRLNGDARVGVRKAYQYDAVGAINAQLRLGYLIDEVRAKLDQTTAVTSQEEIIPLDI